MEWVASREDPLTMLEQADRLKTLLAPRTGVLRLLASGAAALTQDVCRRTETVTQEALDVLWPNFRHVAIFVLDDGWAHGATVTFGNRLFAVQTELAYRGGNFGRIVEGGSVPALSEEDVHRSTITEH